MFSIRLAQKVNLIYHSKMELWPVFICSKGRAQTTKTPKLFKNCIVVVEPQEREKYSKHFPEKIIYVLAENNKGVAFARNSIFDNCAYNKIEKFWILDDDVLKFYECIGKGTFPIEAEKALLMAQKDFETNKPWKMGSLEYKQFGWAKKDKIEFNRACDCIVAYNSPAEIRFDESLKVLEDRDLAIQTISKGFRTIKNFQR